jgi:hypothetical protein
MSNRGLPERLSARSQKVTSEPSRNNQLFIRFSQQKYAAAKQKKMLLSTLKRQCLLSGAMSR